MSLSTALCVRADRSWLLNAERSMKALVAGEACFSFKALGAARAAWRRGPRGQPHFCLAIERLCGPPPPVGGTFWFQIFLHAPSPEIWSETISGSEEVLAGKRGGLFSGYLLRKKFISSRGAQPANCRQTARAR